MLKVQCLFIICLLLTQNSLFGQDVYIGLRQFMDTNFMREYEKMRDESERTVRRFKRDAGRYSEDQVQYVANAYNDSAEQFNQTLYNIKGDILDKQKRRFIVLYPDDYSKQVECDLYRAKDFYSKNFQRAMVEVTGDGSETSSFLLALTTLITVGQGAFDLFVRFKDEWKRYNEGILNKYLIEEYRFRLWDEIN
jgi:hypothetical protein